MSLYQFIRRFWPGFKEYHLIAAFYVIVFLSLPVGCILDVTHDTTTRWVMLSVLGVFIALFVATRKRRRAYYIRKGYLPREDEKD